MRDSGNRMWSADCRLSYGSLCTQNQELEGREMCFGEEF